MFIHLKFEHTSRRSYWKMNNILVREALLQCLIILLVLLLHYVQSKHKYRVDTRYDVSLTYTRGRLASPGCYHIRCATGDAEEWTDAWGAMTYPPSHEMKLMRNFNLMRNRLDAKLRKWMWCCIHGLMICPENPIPWRFDLVDGMLQNQHYSLVVITSRALMRIQFMGISSGYVKIAFFMIILKMTEVKRVGRRRTQLNDYLRNRRRYCELKEEVEDRKRWKRQFSSIEHREEIQIFHKSMNLLMSSIFNN